MATDVAPPHNVSSLKRCIAKSEHVQDWRGTVLFLKPSSEAPMEESSKVDILKRTGLGCNSETPLAFVATDVPEASDARPSHRIPVYRKLFRSHLMLTMRLTCFSSIPSVQ